jgi:hypothetical protein
LAPVADEQHRVGPVAGKRREEAQLLRAEVLDLVYDDRVVLADGRVGEDGIAGEHADSGVVETVRLVHRLLDAVDGGPDLLALLGRERRAAAGAAYREVVVPRPDAARADDEVPFGLHELGVEWDAGELPVFVDEFLGVLVRERLQSRSRPARDVERGLVDVGDRDAGELVL